MPDEIPDGGYGPVHTSAASDSFCVSREGATICVFTPAAARALAARLIAWSIRGVTPAPPGAPPALPTDYILRWLRERNGQELAPALDNMRVGDASKMREELESILAHGGKPPNWVEP